MGESGKFEFRTFHILFMINSSIGPSLAFLKLRIEFLNVIDLVGSTEKRGRKDQRESLLGTALPAIFATFSTSLPAIPPSHPEHLSATQHCPLPVTTSFLPPIGYSSYNILEHSSFPPINQCNWPSNLPWITVSLGGGGSWRGRGDKVK